MHLKLRAQSQLKAIIFGMYRNDGTFQKGNCIEMSVMEGV